MTPELFRDVPAEEAERANRADWDRYADEYQTEHGAFLRDIGFVWGPEGTDEADIGLLGPTVDQRILEVGCGAGQCSRWLRVHGAHAFGVDLSFRQLQHGRRIDDETGVAVPTACATATSLPVATCSVDVVCSAFGGYPFIVDIDSAFAEVRRVLRPGGRFVFSVVHPVRRMFPDDPSPRGMTVVRSYFDRTPYVETDPTGATSYVEPHHTLEDWTRALVEAGLALAGLHEPTWPPGHDRVWGGWGPERGVFVPGTLIVSAVRPRTA